MVDITLKGGLAEGPAPTGMDGASIRDNLKGVVERIGKASADPNVKGLRSSASTACRLGPAKGAAKYKGQAIAEASTRVGQEGVCVSRERRTPTIWSPRPPTRIVMPGSGWLLMLKGLAAEVTFYKG